MGFPDPSVEPGVSYTKNTFPKFYFFQGDDIRFNQRSALNIKVHAVDDNFNLYSSSSIQSVAWSPVAPTSGTFVFFIQGIHQVSEINPSCTVGFVCGHSIFLRCHPLSLRLSLRPRQLYLRFLWPVFRSWRGVHMS